MKPERIKAIMKAKKLTASEFADLVGVPRRTFESYLQGRRNPPERVVVAILAVEGVPNGL
jgi:transcriptional regulator with XRE-family HTH domain